MVTVARHSAAVNLTTASRTIVERAASRSRGLFNVKIMMKAFRVAGTASMLLAGVPAAAQVLPPACTVPGEVIQWIADYCMLKMQTDDEIAVSDCIVESHRTAFPTECAAKIHYKRAMCSLVKEGGGSDKAIEGCLADPAFMGRTVKYGGVGG